MPQRFVTLDLFRGLAAIAVLLFHAERAVPRGYLAVDLFFMLSGFVLYRAYSDRLGDWNQIGDFMIRRIIRLYPLMLAGAAIGLLVKGGSWWVLLLVPTGTNLVYFENVVLWSLLLEVFASIAFALLLRFGKPVGIALVLLGAIALASSIQFHGDANLGFRWATFWPGVARLVFGFTVGVGIGAFFKPGRVRTSGWGYGLVLLPVPFLMIPAGPVMPDLIAIFFVFPAITILGASIQVPEPKSAIWLGSMSYAFYVIHFPLLRLAQQYQVATIWVLAGCVIAAWLLERFYDRNARRFLTMGLDALQRRIRARSALASSAA